MPFNVVGAPTKGIKNLCSQLGEPYVLSVIDGENVIYRDLGNGYDIEVSGADHNRKTIKVTIYVWNVPQHGVVEMIENIRSVEDLSRQLAFLSEKYKHMDSSIPIR